MFCASFTAASFDLCSMSHAHSSILKNCIHPSAALSLLWALFEARLCVICCFWWLSFFFSPLGESFLVSVEAWLSAEADADVFLVEIVLWWVDDDADAEAEEGGLFLLTSTANSSSYPYLHSSSPHRHRRWRRPKSSTAASASDESTCMQVGGYLVLVNFLRINQCMFTFHQFISSSVQSSIFTFYHFYVHTTFIFDLYEVQP